jgi:hypothetical protein
MALAGGSSSRPPTCSSALSAALARTEFPRVNSRHCTGRSTPTPDAKEITVNTSTGNLHSDETVRRFLDHALGPGDAVAVEELIAYVLRRAHRMANAFNAPNEARAILHVAHSFADELATANPRFDRRRFIRAATEPPA